MARTFRFVDPQATSTVRLDLNDGVTWALAQGLDFGVADLASEGSISAPPYPGDIEYGLRRARREMQVPLCCLARGTDAILAAFNALNTELDRAANAIEWKPHGSSGASQFLDTYRAPLVSPFRGQALPGDDFASQDLGALVIVIPYHPVSRAGVYV